MTAKKSRGERGSMAAVTAATAVAVVYLWSTKGRSREGRARGRPRKR